MRRSGLIALAAACGLLVLVGMLYPDAKRPEQSLTTFGTGPWGYRAVFDLLTELGFPVARTHEPPEKLAPDATVWWIEPAGLCRAAAWPGEPWVRAGGTAVLFLAPGTGEDGGCELLAGVALPRRVADASAGAGRRGERSATPHEVT